MKLNIRSDAWLVVRALTGTLCMFVSFHGGYSAWAMDFRANPIMTSLYCLVPAMSILVFCFARSHWIEAALQTAVAAGFLTLYSMMNWRTCAALGYCGTVASTVAETLKTRTVEAALGVVVLTLVAVLLERTGRTGPARESSKSIEP